MSHKVSAVVHVEMVHPDPDAAAKFMREVLGAEQVEIDFSTYIEGFIPNSRIIHMRTGNVVFQFVKPLPELESWHRQYTSTGPGIHNVTVQVDGLEDVRSEMLARGCKEIGAFDKIDLRPAGYKSDGPFKCYVIDASEQAGIRFEMIPTESGYKPPS